METMTLSPASRAAEPLPESEAALRRDEAEIMRAAMGGDARAFERIVHAQHRRVFNFLYHMTRQRQDAEDLTQHTFLKAFQHIGRVDPERSILPWLFTIARRIALNHFRSARNWEVMPADLASNDPSPASQAETKERAENIWTRARQILSRREFEALWLRCAEELSTEETARVMGLTRIHVKVLVHRARRHLLKGENCP